MLDAAAADIGRWLQLFKKYGYHSHSPSELFWTSASWQTAMSQYSTGSEYIGIGPDLQVSEPVFVSYL